MMSVKVPGAGTIRPSAEERGYEANLLDAEGYELCVTDQPPAGVLLRVPAMPSAVWIPVADLAAVGDLMIRLHVQVARLRGAR